MTGDHAAYERKGDKARHVREADVKPLEPVDDEGAKGPGNQQWIVVIAPLNAEGSDGIRRDQEHHRDSEIGRIPYVATLRADHVFRSNANEAAEGIEPPERRPN